MKKRLLFIMFALMAIATGMQADEYGVYICGVMVTDDNINSLSSIDGVKGGTITFDGTTLTLTDVTIDASNKPCHGMSHMRNDLTIHLEGTNRIFSDLAAVCLRGKTTITGPGKLEATGKQQGIMLDYFQENSIQLTIQDEAHIVAKGDKYGIYGNPSSYSRVNVRINGTTKAVEAWGGDGSFCNMNSIFIRRPLEVIEPTGAKVSAMGSDIVDADGNVVKGEWVKIAEPLGIAINETNFPDPVFRTYVKAACQSDGDDWLTDEEIAAVMSLYPCYCEKLYHSPVSDLTGIGYFTELTYLDCNNMGLSSLDVSKNTKLETLMCDGNRLSSLDVSKNTNLSCLKCHHNQIKGVEMDKLIASLPEKETGTSGLFTAISIFDSEEGSEVTVQQVEAANQKGWNIYYIYIDGTTTTHEEYTPSFAEELANSIVINEANFPDRIFRLFVRVDFQEDNNVWLTPDEIAVRKYIYCDNAKDYYGAPISDLTGIEYFTELIELDCSLNCLSSLDLSNNTKLNLLFCQMNQIKGAEMDKLIASLPDTGGTMHAISPFNPDEGNEMTPKQLAAANKKKWKVYYWSGETTESGEWLEYTGSFIVPTAISNVSPEASSDSPFYSLDGQRIVGKLTKKGVYVRDGKKVVVK